MFYQIESNIDKDLENLDKIDLKICNDPNKILSDVLNSIEAKYLNFDNQNFSIFFSSFIRFIVINFRIIINLNKTEDIRRILQNFIYHFKLSTARLFEAKLVQSINSNMKYIPIIDKSKSYIKETNEFQIISILFITESYLTTKLITNSSLIYQITSFILRFPKIQSFKLLSLLHPRNLHDSTIVFHGLLYFITHYIDEIQDLQNFDEYCLKTMKNVIYPVDKQIIPLFSVKLLSFLKYFSQIYSKIPKLIDFYFEIILIFFEIDHRSIHIYKQLFLSYYKIFHTSISFIIICQILKINFDDLKQFLDTNNDEEKISIECSLIRLNPEYENKLENIDNSSCKRIFSLLETNKNSVLFLEKFQTKYKLKNKEMINILCSSDNIDLICLLLNKGKIKFNAFRGNKQKMAEILKNYEKNYENCEEIIPAFVKNSFNDDKEMTYLLSKYSDRKESEFSKEFPIESQDELDEEFNFKYLADEKSADENFDNFKPFFIKEKNFKCSEDFFDRFETEIFYCLEDLLNDYSNDQLLVSILKYNYEKFTFYFEFFKHKNIEFVYHIFKILLEQNSYIIKDKSFQNNIIDVLKDLSPEIRNDFMKLFFPKVKQNTICEINISEEYLMKKLDFLDDEIDDGCIDDDYLSIKENNKCSKMTKLNLSRFVYFNRKKKSELSYFVFMFSMYFAHKDFFQAYSDNQLSDCLTYLRVSMIRLNDYYVNNDEFYKEKIYEIVSKIIVINGLEQEKAYLKEFANVFTNQQINEILNRHVTNNEILNIYQSIINRQNIKISSEYLPIKVIDSIISRDDFEFKEIPLNYFMNRDLPDVIETKISQKCQKLKLKYSKNLPNFNYFYEILNYFIRPMLQEFGSISYHIGHYILHICEIINEEPVKFFIPIPNTSLGNFNIFNEISEEEKEDFSYIKTPNDIAIEMYRNHKNLKYRSLVFGCTCSFHLSRYLLIHVFDDIENREQNCKKLTKIIKYLFSKEHQGTKKILNFIFSLYPNFYNKEYNVFKNDIINQNDLISAAMKMQKYEICLRHLDCLNEENQQMIYKIYSNLDDFDNLEYFYSSMFEETKYYLFFESKNTNFDQKFQVLKYLEHQGLYDELKLFSLRLMNQYPANDELIGFIAKLAIKTEDFDLMKEISEINSKDFYCKLIKFILDYKESDESLKEYIDELRNKYLQGNFDNLQIIENQISILRSIYDGQFDKSSDNELATVVNIIMNKKLDKYCKDVIEIYFNLIKKLRKEESLNKAEFYSKNAMIYALQPHWNTYYIKIQVETLLEQLKISIMKNDQKNIKIISQRLSIELKEKEQTMSKEYMKFNALLSGLEIKEHAAYGKSKKLIEEGLKYVDQTNKGKYSYLFATICDKLFIESHRFEYFKLTIDNYFSALALEKHKKRLDIIPRLFDLLFRIGSKYFSFLIPDQKYLEEEEFSEYDDEDDDVINEEIKLISDKEKKNFYDTFEEKINNCTHQISISAESIIPLVKKLYGKKKLREELMRILKESFLQEGAMSIWHFFILIEENQEFKNLIEDDPNTKFSADISKILTESYCSKIPTDGKSTPYICTTYIDENDPINKSLERIKSSAKAIVPTTNNLHSYSIDDRKNIFGVKATKIIGSQCCPMELNFISNSGDQFLFLLKNGKQMDGKELKMRRDMRIMDIFTFINSVFNLDTFCKNRHLNITTYAVICLNSSFSLIEKVPDSTEMRNVYAEIYSKFDERRKEYHKSIRNKQSFVECSEKFREEFPHPMKDWFCLQFKDPKKWFSAQKEFTISCAVLSWVGSIFKIDDRHLGNILLIRETGTVFHVDFQEILDPKIIADFRLTHIILDGLGVCGVNGSFTKCCVITAKNLKSNRDALVSLMEGFIEQEFDEENPQELLDQLKKRVDMVSDNGCSSVSPEPLVYSKIACCQQIDVLYDKNRNWKSYM